MPYARHIEALPRAARLRAIPVPGMASLDKRRYLRVEPQIDKPWGRLPWRGHSRGAG